MDKVQNILKTTYSRDKLGKILQYGFKFFSWFQKDISNNEKKGKQYAQISSQISLSRKLSRLGRFIHEYEQIYTFFNKNMQKAGVSEWINVLKLTFLSNYWVKNKSFI